MHQLVKEQTLDFQSKYGTPALVLNQAQENIIKERLLPKDPDSSEKNPFHVKKPNSSLYKSPDTTLGTRGSFTSPSDTILGSPKWLSYKWVTQNLEKGNGWYYCHATGVKALGNGKAMQGRLNKSVIAKAIKEFDPKFKTLIEDNLYSSGFGKGKSTATPEQEVENLVKRISELRAKLAK